MTLFETAKLSDGPSLFHEYEYSVSQISNEIKTIIEANLGYVRVKGEISGLKIAASGHGYFNLKDEGAVLACTCWRSAMSKINIKLEDGIEVVAIGKISTYAGQSKYQLSVDKVEISGVGNLMKVLAERKEKFEKEGLFDRAHKKPLPFLPKTIGVVTSITGSVIKDIIHRISDRFPSKILIWPITVQGESAAKEVSDAINNFNAQAGEMRPDVIIVARGGGSIEDLWAFNEEIVVRSVFSSQIPIISAVGHETDFTLIDFVADIRAPTPTAAAEFAVPVLKDLKFSLNNYINILTEGLNNYFENKEKLLAAYRSSLDLDMFISQKQQRLDDLCFALLELPDKYFQIKHLELSKIDVLSIDLSYFLSNLNLTLKTQETKLKHEIATFLEKKTTEINLHQSLLETLDIKNVLKRGFAIVKQDDRIISYKKEFDNCSQVEMQFQDGSIIADINVINNPR